MRVLLDTSALFWWYGKPEKLSRDALSIISEGENSIIISPATAWELSIKSAIGKLDALALVLDFSTYVSEEGFIEMPITALHAIRAGMLPQHHKDPFDRLLIAQAQELSIPIVSSDRALEKYGVMRIW